MAEAVMRHKVREAGLTDRIQVDSAGTAGWHAGNPPHEGTRNILKQYGIDAAGIHARQVRYEDYTDFRYIIAMDDSNIGNLAAVAPADHQAEVRKLLEFTKSGRGGDVPDPYYTGNFDEVYEMVEEGCERILAYICEREGLA